MTEQSSPPAIEPTTFDLIIVGTGLPESIIAAGAASAGKSVLHLDPSPFYGSHFSSLSLSELTSFLQSHSTASTSPTTTTTNTSDSDFYVINLTTDPLYSDVEVSPISPDLEQSRKFNIDVSGPRVLFCADSIIDLMLKSGVNQYLEFKSIDASFICDGNGNMSSVPDSRAAIFKDRSLGLTEKNQFMRFLKLVQEHLESVGSSDYGGESGERMMFTEEDLESSFVEFLTKMRLPPKIKSIILYAITMTDYDQENLGATKVPLKTKDGISRLALYHSSIGRFSNASGAMLYPMYGQGELSQAFCRRAAVKGCLYVLRMPVVGLLVDKGTGLHKGIRLASGQDLFSMKLVLDPQFIVPQAIALSSPNASEDRLPRTIKGKVARGICITSRSLKSDVSNLLVVCPPRSLYPEQETSIRILQIGSNLAVCPPNMFVLYLSSWCDDACQGKKLLNGAISALLTIAVAGRPENNSTGNPEDNFPAQSEIVEDAKPTLLWSSLHIQEVMEGSCESICSTLSPDGNLSYNDLVDSTLKMFQKMYPDEEFFPETSSSEGFDDDNHVNFDDNLHPNRFGSQFFNQSISSMVEKRIENSKYAYIHGDDAEKWPPEMVDIHHVVAVRRNSSLKRAIVSLSALPLLYSSFYLFLGKDKSVTILVCCFLIGAFFVKLLRRKLIERESVVIIPAFGIQLETHYRSGRIVRRFVPINEILKAVLNECVTPVTCYWSLALILRGEDELMLVFKQMRLPLKMLVPVWRALCAAADGEKLLRNIALAES
ncbi:hypothetical protein Nepgr_025842 [Nepenthes gracilis]|uniref:Phosphatidylinositol N-acetylglucosaminyltransferase subunit H conserved domain-containing protein n=1 Tax=Nepenthes gracilis TaxID=150966 RepID=A0AAD3Y1G4_NEPGR|nr:hypothetical protein Nepgr_025842 [Nepenthes gracilis]